MKLKKPLSALEYWTLILASVLLPLLFAFLSVQCEAPGQ